jgi:hypothetical protein
LSVSFFIIHAWNAMRGVGRGGRILERAGKEAAAEIEKGKEI